MPETPSKRVAKRVAAPPREPVLNGDDDDEDEPEEVPSVKPTMKSPLRPGTWGEGQRVLDSTSSYAQAFRPDEKAVIIKFLEDHPYAAFRRHWIEQTNNEGMRGVRAYTCPVSFDEECPLCEIGDRPQAVSAFNIAIVDENGSCTLKSWDVGARLFNVLKSYATDPKIAPLTKGFFLVSKTGKKSQVQYNVSPIKASVLEEDYDTVPPTEEDLKRLVPYTVDIVEITPKHKLRELAAEQSDYE